MGKNDKGILELELGIIRASWFEHYKFLNDISRYTPLNDPRRKNIQDEINIMQEKMTVIQKKIESIEKMLLMNTWYIPSIFSCKFS